MWSSFANGLCSFEYFDVNDTAQRVGPGTFGVTAKYQWSQDGVTCTLRMKKEKLSFSFRMIVSDDAIAVGFSGNGYLSFWTRCRRAAEALPNGVKYAAGGRCVITDTFTGEEKIWRVGR